MEIHSLLQRNLILEEKNRLVGWKGTQGSDSPPPFMANVGSGRRAAGVMPVAGLGGQRMVKSPGESEIRYPRQGCPTFPLPLP